MIELFEFQTNAANQLVDGFIDYFSTGQDRVGGRLIPYVGQLKAVTGAGKTPILANVVGRLNHAIVLWTTKFGSVVDQTVANLKASGKYHHLFGGTNVEIAKFTEIRSPAEWHRILEKKTGITILVSTVAAWNSTEKDERLNVHRIHKDWGTTSRWDQLRSDRHRNLWVVYDEAHNTTDDQIDLLIDLDPAGFFVASASPVGGKLHQYLSALSEDARKKRIVPVRTRDVVDKQLLKSTISIEDYHTSWQDMIKDVFARQKYLASELTAIGSDVSPKAIYVVESSNAAEAGEEPRPIAIWHMLVKTCGIDPAHVAVCTNTKASDLPRDARKVTSLSQLSESFTHIIFNKKLQEGWDDPSVYLCYFDGATKSANRIQQVIGRALRQPNAKHFSHEDLNTAVFFIHCPNRLLEKITDELKEDLRIYKGDDEPDDFEPFKFKDDRKSLPKIPIKPSLVGKLRVPRLVPELPPGFDPLRALVEKETFGFEAEDERKAPGQVLVNVVAVKTGDTVPQSRDLLEDMRVRCGAFLQAQIKSLSRNCANAMHTSVFTNKKLDRTACYKSKALEHYKNLALKVVEQYENHVELTEMADPDNAEYVIDAFSPTGSVHKPFNNAAHPYYDSKSLIYDTEDDMAKCLDKLPYTWVRNKDRIGYGIPLPVKSESSNTFYPDFLWWVKGTIWGIDPTGKFILAEKVRTKLLAVPAPLRIALLTPKTLNSDFRVHSNSGWTLLRHRKGRNTAPECFDNLSDALSTLVSAS